ncbi:hypothetical protein SUDANB43_02118 [Streptomyces sp. enrichment culture]
MGRPGEEAGAVVLASVDRLLAHTPARSSPASTSRSPGVSGGPDSGGSGGPARAARTADGWNKRVGGVRMLVTSQSAEAAAKLPVAALVIRRVYAVTARSASPGRRPPRVSG